MTLESLFTTSFKLTLTEQVTAVLASLCFSSLAAESEPVELHEVCASPQYGYTASANELPVGPRFVRITDIKAGAVNWPTVPYCLCDDPERYLLQPSDILIARTGSIGKSFLVKDVPEPSVFASYLIRLRPGESIAPKYLYWMLQTVQFWDHVSNTRGTAQKNVNAKKLERFKVPVVGVDSQILVAKWLDEWRETGGSSVSSAPPGLDRVDGALPILLTVERLHHTMEVARREVEELLPSALNRIFECYED